MMTISHNRPIEELKDRLMNLLKEREEVASEFRNRHSDGDWEEALDLAIEWWELGEKIDDARKEMARSIEKSREG